MKLLFKDGDYILEPHTSGEQDELSELVGFHVSVVKQDLRLTIHSHSSAPDLSKASKER